MKLHLLLAVGALVLVACTSGDSIVAPGPGDTDTTTTTVAEGDGGEVETSDETTTTAPEDGTDVDPGENDEGEVQSIEPEPVPPADFVLDETSDNAAVFTELAISGLVLSLDEQGCADETAAAAVDSGSDELTAVIGAIQTCATASAIDDFSADLIVAGGAPLPATEAACVSARLQSGEEYQPFWAALLEEEPFDFLLADLDVQNRFLELYTECVSVGRAVAAQASVDLSAGTTGCIDGLYADREFVRSSIEADLSGNADDQARINDQIATCLTNDERSALGLQ